MAYVRLLLESWLSREPMGSLWLVMAAFAVFGVTFIRSHGKDSSAWNWSRGLLESLVKALAFTALVGVVYFLLNSSYAAFSKIYGSFTTSGSLSNLAREKWLDVYGGAFFEQRDLEVTQYISVETQKVVQPEGSLVPLYRNVIIEQPIAENSITRFRGDVTVRDADREHQGNTFNAFALSVLYQYDIINPTETVTRAEFKFPLFPGAKLYQDISIRVNEQEVDWRILEGAIVWDKQMKPGEKDTVSVRYSTWGMEGFQYKVPTPREILDFKLVITTDCAFG